MIKLGKHSVEYITASGAMGYDGQGWPHEQPLRWCGLLDTSLFAHVAKSTTLLPREGNYKWYRPWDCMRPIFNGPKIVGFVNAFGLTNPGFKWWTKVVGPSIDSSKTQLIASIFGDPDELVTMAEALNDLDLVAVEINASCPNDQGNILHNVRRVIRSCELVENTSRHSIILKISVVHNIEIIVPEIEGMVDAFDINSVPWGIIFPGRKSPMAKHGGGGVSGKVAQQFTWPFAEKLQSITRTPVIAPSVWDYEDIGILRAKGFRAFSFGSVFLRYPWRPTLYARKDREYQKNSVPLRVAA